MGTRLNEVLLLCKCLQLLKVCCVPVPRGNQCQVRLYIPLHIPLPLLLYQTAVSGGSGARGATVAPPVGTDSSRAHGHVWGRRRHSRAAEGQTAQTQQQKTVGS